jgi:hypothetical protein
MKHIPQDTYMFKNQILSRFYLCVEIGTQIKIHVFEKNKI